MKKQLSLCYSMILLISHCVASAQNRSIQFDHATFSELKSKALKENKLIFIDAYTTWCGPCKEMAKHIFTNDTVADYYNTHFVNAKIDMEKGEGLKIAKEYSVQCYPNLLFIDGNGNLIHRSAGSMEATTFVELAKIAESPDANFKYYKDHYENNKNNSSFVKSYIQLIDGSCLDPKQEVMVYFSEQKEDDLLSQQNWEMIRDYTRDLNSREFNYLVNHQNEFEKSYGVEAVKEKIMDVCSASLYAIIKSKAFDQKTFDETKLKITFMKFSGADQVIFEADLRLAKSRKDWVNYAKLACDHVDQYYLNDASTLNSLAWTFYENVDDQNQLLKAEHWAKKAIEIEKSYAVMDTYASVLYKEGKKQEALQAANQAIEQAKKENLSKDDYEPTLDLIKKINEIK